MTDIQINFDGMRAGIAAVDNAHVGIDNTIVTTMDRANDLSVNWQGQAQRAWLDIIDDWATDARKANERLKNLEAALKKILDSAVQREGDRADKAAQAQFNKQFQG